MNSKVKIFKAEKDAGLGEQIRTSSSVAYVTQLQPLDITNPFAQRLMKTVASEQHPSDTLFLMKDVLVSTGWNLNKDIFDNGETWIARNTSLHHPINFEHDEKHIIGNITASQAVNDEMEAIADEMAVDELPIKFHILNGSVIYRVWQDEEQQKLIDKTIAEIEKGEWYVSMECVFRGFDYGVIRPDESTGVIERNEASAWLTKHLTHYGGNGIYKCQASGQEFKLGRVLRNINFIGKGLVRRPANPESVILNHVSAFVSASKDLGYIKAEEEVTSIEPPESTDMSEPNVDIKKLEDRVTELLRANEELKTQLKDKDGLAAKAEIDVLKTEVTSRDNKISTLETSVSELTKSVNDLTKRAEESEAAKSTVDTELATLKAEKVEQERLAIMTGKGASPEKAAELVKTFKGFSPEQFNAIVETLSAAWKTTTTKTAEQVIAGAKKEDEPTLTAGSETAPDAEASRAKAAKHIGTYLRYNKNVPAVTGQETK